MTRARFCTCSLSRMWRRWYLIVFSLTKRRSASSRLEVIPCTKSSSTSRSRVVKASAGCGAGPDSGRANAPRTLRARLGVSAGSPRVTPSSSSKNRLASRSFGRNPCAPDFTASKRSASSSDAVRTTTAISGSSVVMRRVAARPPSSGMVRSMSTTSGRWIRASSTASRPLRASATTSTPCASSRLRSPSRKREWSSAISTRNSRLLVPCSHWFGREVNGDAGSLTRNGSNLERAPHSLGPLSHRRHAEPRQISPAQTVRIEPDALILDDHLDTRVGRSQPHPCSPRVGVLADVGEGFLDDPQQLDFAHRRQPRIVPRRGEEQFDSHVTLPLPEIEIVPQRLDESTIFAERSAETEDPFPDVGVGFAGGLRELAELGGGALWLVVLEQRLGGLGFGVHVSKHLSNAVVHLARDSLPLLGNCQRPHLAVETRILDRQGGQGRKTRQRLLVVGIESRCGFFLGEVEIAQHTAMRDDRQGEQ